MALEHRSIFRNQEITEKKITCTTCPKTYRFIGGLKRHQRVCPRRLDIASNAEDTSSNNVPKYSLPGGLVGVHSSKHDVPGSLRRDVEMLANRVLQAHNANTATEYLNPITMKDTRAIHNFSDSRLLHTNRIHTPVSTILHSDEDLLPNLFEPGNIEPDYTYTSMVDEAFLDIAMPFPLQTTPSGASRYNPNSSTYSTGTFVPRVPCLENNATFGIVTAKKKVDSGGLERLPLKCRRLAGAKEESVDENQKTHPYWIPNSLQAFWNVALLIPHAQEISKEMLVDYDSPSDSPVVTPTDEVPLPLLKNHLLLVTAPADTAPSCMDHSTPPPLNPARDYFTDPPSSTNADDKPLKTHKASLYNKPTLPSSTKDARALAYQRFANSIPHEHSHFAFTSPLAPVTPGWKLVVNNNATGAPTPPGSSVGPYSSPEPKAVLQFKLNPAKDPFISTSFFGTQRGRGGVGDDGYVSPVRFHYEERDSYAFPTIFFPPSPRGSSFGNWTNEPTVNNDDDDSAAAGDDGTAVAIARRMETKDDDDPHSESKLGTELGRYRYPYHPTYWILRSSPPLFPTSSTYLKSRLPGPGLGDTELRRFMMGSGRGWLGRGR